MQTDFIERLTAKAVADPRIRAAWLEGSFGRGVADRWSDVDAHLLIREEALDSFRAQVEAWLAEIRPLVLFRLLFGGQMVNAMTDQGLRLDVWLHQGDTAETTEGRAQVLHQEEGTLAWQPEPDSHLTHDAAQAELERTIPEFWRCIAMLPVALGRDETIVGAAGNFLIVLLLADALSVRTGRRKDRGVKALNDFLAPEDRRLVEAAISLPELTKEALARFQLRLACIMQEHGPAICERWSVDYPHALEDATLCYVVQELRSLGIASALEELPLWSETTGK